MVVKKKKKKKKRKEKKKKSIRICDVYVNDIVISKLVETENNSKYLIGNLDKVIRPLVLILIKLNGYVKIFKVKVADKDKNNKLRSFHIDVDNLLEKY